MNQIDFWARRTRGAPLLALMCAMLLALAAPRAFGAEPDAIAGTPRICLRGPADAPIPFHGVVSFDAAGSGASAMLYPAPGLAGMLAAVATHAIIGNAMREDEKQRMREAADLVLLPYQEALRDYRHAELMQASLASMRAPGDIRVATAARPAAGDTVIDSVPVYYMTQDQRALILEHTVSIRTNGAANPHVRVIRVVSPARDEKAGVAGWFNQSDNMLRQVSARMFAHSLEIALADMKSPGESADPFRTVRYSEGGTERIERAQVVSDQCGQLVLRTLRGNLISVPRKGAAADAACPGS